MNKLLLTLLLVGLLVGVLGCALSIDEAPAEETKPVQEDNTEIEVVGDSDDDMAVESVESLSEDFLQAIDDWILGTDFGITDVRFEDNTFIVSVPDDIRESYEPYQIQDIEDGLMGLADYGGYDVKAIVWSTGDALASPDVITDANDDNQQDEETEAEDEMTSTATDTTNLIFIHHSVGANWLKAGLNQMLNDAGIHVADTYYGWAEMGDHTDTVDWPNWFNDDVMPAVYSELDTATAHNAIQPGPGENAIIMFKSCYPNSDVGNSIEDEKQIYLSLLDYFAAHPDKMFVLVTPPPMMRISNPAKTRELANWLVAADGYRAGYAGENLFVFDLYNVFTAPDNHHWLVDGLEQHEINDASNTLYYDSDGDNHPNDVGNVKASVEFVPLLLHWYSGFVGE